ncbi:hypothetical protein KI387_010041, partial [Taxus chinensis]
MEAGVGNGILNATEAGVGNGILNATEVGNYHLNVGSGSDGSPSAEFVKFEKPHGTLQEHVPEP